jgi:hypothetical protein
MSDLSDLLELLDALPQKRARNRPDLFSLSGISHYEEVLSNWYAFFLDGNGQHKLGTLFLDTLLELHADGSMIRAGGALRVKREHTTINGKAVDLVLHDGEESDSGIIKAGHAIVIENKVYHQMVNDFDEYWDSVSAQNKIGIILCLKEVISPHSKFQTITHKAFIDQVVAKLHFTASVPEPYRQYLLDLHQNIHELSAHMEFSNEVKFYLEHAKRIQRVYQLERALKEYLKAQLLTVAEALGVGLYPSGQKYWYMCLPEDDEAYYTILLDEVLEFGSDGDLIIVVEIQGTKELDLSKFYEAAKKHLKPNVHPSEPLHRRGTNFIHYAPIRIPMSLAAGGKLNETILERIKNDLAPILNAADTFLNTQ